jgi:hypothetical protein
MRASSIVRSRGFNRDGVQTNAAEILVARVMVEGD